MKSAKNAFPEFGKLYGLYSKEFSHIGQLHKQVTPVREFSDPNSEESESNLAMIRTLTWMAYVTSELVFLDLVGVARYWTMMEIDQPDLVAYKFDPSHKEKEWMRNFLDLDAP